jgi:hypothetical protein
MAVYISKNVTIKLIKTQNSFFLNNTKQQQKNFIENNYQNDKNNNYNSFFYLELIVNNKTISKISSFLLFKNCIAKNKWSLDNPGFFLFFFFIVFLIFK